MCAAYIIAGFIGRDAWRSADITAVAFMGEIARGHSAWFNPLLAGLPPENPALLPYWLGALVLLLTPNTAWWDITVRIPFVLSLACTLACTWYASYYLARSPSAQPVGFAFGGEAKPKDYARAIADGGLLAILACLGLAQMAHESTPESMQLAWVALMYASFATLPHRKTIAQRGLAVAALGLALSGGAVLGSVLVGGGLVIIALQARAQKREIRLSNAGLPFRWVMYAVVVIALTVYWQQWTWSATWPSLASTALFNYCQMLIWFAWPAWPMAAWALWRWRFQLRFFSSNQHLALSVWFALVPTIASAFLGNSDRVLLWALPPLSGLAAFALPVLRRQVGALIDWFTLLFFSFCGLAIWVVWIAMQTGMPATPAANVAKLVPAFKPTFSSLLFAIAVVSSLIWLGIVRWRANRHRAAIWKSLVLPASGATLCWVLLMTLWLPLLNFSQSYVDLTNRVSHHLKNADCIQTAGLSQSKVAAMRWYGNLPIAALTQSAPCEWLIAQEDAPELKNGAIQLAQWILIAKEEHRADYLETLLIYRKK